MNDRGVSLKASIFIAVPIALLIVGLLIWSTLNGRGGLRLRPALPDPTAIKIRDDQSPAAVSFGELNDNPVAYLNQTIIVSGNYMPVEKPDCLRYSGPKVEWSLTADNLQLDALGFERIIRLVRVGSSMTVQGIWRLYQGPLGCGKGPANGTAWYLDVKKILQPNPIVSEGGQIIPINIGNGDPGLPELLPTLEKDLATPTTTNDILTVPAVGTGIASPTVEGQATFTITPASTGDVPLTATVQQTGTPLAPTGTSAVSPTATGVTLTPVATSDPSNPTATLTPELPPVPATATENPDGGYPGPAGTLTPTPSPDPYL